MIDLKRRSLLAVSSLLLGGLIGCSGPDNPKIADAPAYTPPANVQAPVIPGKKTAIPYGQNPKYQEAMEKQAQQNAR